jgi:hypothetical protein
MLIFLMDVIRRVLWMHTDVMGWCNYLQEKDRRIAAKKKKKKKNSQVDVKALSRHCYLSTALRI